MYTGFLSHFVGREKQPVDEIASEDRRKQPLSTRVIVGMVGPRCMGVPRNLTLSTRCLHFR